jgi:hypothetical protein
MWTGSSLPIIAQDRVRMRVFVSYSRRDSEFVDRLDEALTQLGYDLWIDREDISGSGDDRWRHSIVRAIRECDAMMLVLSSNSVVSENVERELSVASDSDKRVVPVRHQPCELPVGFQYELSGVQYVDFATVGFTEAVRQLSARLGPATGPSAGVTPTASAAAAGPIAPVSPTRARRWRQIHTYAVMGVIVGIVVAAIVALIGGDDKRNPDFPPGTDNGPAIGEAFELDGPRVAFNPGDHFVLTMGNRILVITNDGRVFGHDVNGSIIGEAFELDGPPVAFNPGDHFVLTMGNRILVITNDGRVFGHDVNGSIIGEAFELDGPPVAFNLGDHFVLTMGNRILVITNDGRVFGHDA